MNDGDEQISMSISETLRGDYRRYTSIKPRSRRTNMEPLLSDEQRRWARVTVTSDAEEFGIRDRHECYQEGSGYLGEDHSMHFEGRSLIHTYFDRVEE